MRRHQLPLQLGLIVLGALLLAPLLLSSLPVPAQAQDLPTPTVTPAANARPDRCEPNDTPAQACVLQLDAVNGPFTFLPEGDADYFSVDLGEAPTGLALSVSVRGTPGLDLRTTISRAGDDEPLAVLSSGQISTTLPVELAGWLVLRVENLSPALPLGESYNLELRRVLPPPPPPPDALAARPALLPDPLENNWSPATAAPIIDLIGPGSDPTLPPEQARVTLAVRAPAGLDWPTLAPTLLLASDQALLPAAIEPAADGATLSYLIPLPGAPLEAAWRVTTADGRVLRWRIQLNPPPTRDATLREALRVTAVEAQLTDAGVMELRITLANRGVAPLMLTPADLALTQGETPLSLPMIAGLEAPLEPGATRTLTVSVVPGRSAQPLILRIGHERFQIRGGKRNREWRIENEE